jgi:hypothetical protein
MIAGDDPGVFSNKITFDFPILLQLLPDFPNSEKILPQKKPRSGDRGFS